MAEYVLRFQPQAAPKTAGRVARIGLFLRRNRRPIIAVQWLVVVFYAAMVIIPGACLSMLVAGFLLLSEGFKTRPADIAFEKNRK